MQLSDRELRIMQEKQARSDSLNHLLQELNDQVDDLIYDRNEWRMFAFIAFTIALLAIGMLAKEHFPTIIAGLKA